MSNFTSHIYISILILLVIHYIVTIFTIIFEYIIIIYSLLPKYRTTTDMHIYYVFNQLGINWGGPLWLGQCQCSSFVFVETSWSVGWISAKRIPTRWNVFVISAVTWDSAAKECGITTWWLCLAGRLGPTPPEESTESLFNSAIKITSNLLITIALLFAKDHGPVELCRHRRRRRCLVIFTPKNTLEMSGNEANKYKSSVALNKVFTFFQCTFFNVAGGQSHSPKMTSIIIILKWQRRVLLKKPDPRLMKMIFTFASCANFANQTNQRAFEFEIARLMISFGILIWKYEMNRININMFEYNVLPMNRGDLHFCQFIIRDRRSIKRGIVKDRLLLLDQIIIVVQLGEGVNR